MRTKLTIFMKNFSFKFIAKGETFASEKQGMSPATISHNDAMEKCKNKQNNNNDLMRGRI